MEHILIAAGPTTYLVSDQEVPRRNQLPWRGEECDAFVAILDAGRLTDQLAEKVSFGLLGLRIDWVETMGRRSEFLHDCVDKASMAVGRQIEIGDGRPMTAWHEGLADIEPMIEYIRLGGQGASEYKLVLVIGPEHSAAAFADRLRPVLRRENRGQ